MNQLKDRVDRFIARLQREDVCMHGFILSVNGDIKATAYYAPFEEGRPHRMYSVSKTMTALALSLLMDEGKVALDDPITRYFEDYLPAEPDPRLMRTTIRDMLCMCSCHRATAYREGIDEDWAKAFFTVTPTHEPGTVFHYDTGASQVLAALVKRLSGQNVLDFLQERVWQPLGATDEKFWLCDPSGVNQGGTGLCMSLRDMHKTAHLVADGGRDLLPRWFCDEMTMNHVDTSVYTNPEERHGYGWQCWRTRSGWAMYGLGGQLAVMCPEKRAILCTIADTRLDPQGVQRIYDAFYDEVYPYIGQEDMVEQRYQLAVSHLPSEDRFEMSHAGPYVFGENPLKLRRVTLQGHELLWENDRGCNVLRFGVHENVIDRFPGFPDRITLCSGGWLREGVLAIRCQLIDHSPSGVYMLLRFKGDVLTVHARRATDPALTNYEGVASGHLQG